MVKAPTTVPKLHIYFIKNDTFQFQYNIFEAFTFKLRSGVIWPGEVALNNHRFFMKFYKVNKTIWKKPLYKSLNLEKHPTRIRKIWKTKVINKKQLTHDTCLLSIQVQEPGFNHVPVCYHVPIAKKIFEKHVEMLFDPVPLLPMESLKVPNPYPGYWFRTDREIHLLVKSCTDKKINHWLYRRKVGDGIFMGNPKGDFDPTPLLQMKKVYLFAAGSGFSVILSILVWILQQDRGIKVKLFYFNRYERDIIWRNELNALQEKFLFQVEYILSQPEKNNWSGRRGRINLEMLKDMIEPYEKKKKDTFFVLSGSPLFSYTIAYNLTTLLGYPALHVHKFARS
ncbi:cytochrome b5 reductase 4-like [Lycorma delicatula]|uniref:cytochrome b5 reductase 4-like n=1 Tax=Lycorma delicatula TaxID=130591 RepID=UPI003F5103FE